MILIMVIIVVREGPEVAIGESERADTMTVEEIGQMKVNYQARRQ